ncbi:glycosyltransferase family 4 protein [Corynebacterium tapiri]|uniref:phosphatidyl-myo-inositol dimannoside synthase n=1 Tax=Corynebacterium tapiri TaxID=1448266 RepID=A0A5C4U5F2_9CORY|nr:glycosyltransferase family 4 protein [Corynebacterium tapiri]TNL99419.1 glycosyltransferase family 4 protein [Corynebacterium tapiri]
MGRTLLVTNDFPPTIGGIQSYVRDFAAQLDPESLIVFASTQDPVAAAMYDESLDYRVIRWPRRVMLPTRSAGDALVSIIKEFDVETVWFAAAAPLGLLAPRARHAGARTIVASTHGHEVGWAMLPGARQTLRKIGRSVDVVTYISEYTRQRLQPVMGPHPQYCSLPAGVDTDFFSPGSEQGRKSTRDRFGFGDKPVIVCVSRLVPRKGQDALIEALPTIRESVPDAQLVLVGEGAYLTRLRGLARRKAVTEAVHFLGALERGAMRDVLATADLFAMPARTRVGGLDVEGLGIVYLEAQACGVPVIAGSSGGAPETVTSQSAVVVDGHDVAGLARAITTVLLDAPLRATMGQAGREHVEQHWTWEQKGQQLRSILKR